jgi:hypothetical protein
MASRIYYSEEARNRAQAARARIAVLSLGLGISIGAILALLFAPEEGTEVRERITDQAQDFRSDVEDRVRKIAK